MKNIYNIILGLLLVTACSGNDSEKKDESDFRKEVTNKAGSSAHNCGDFKLGGDRTAVDECVAQYFSNLEPFYATYQRQGIDSIVKSGLAFNSRFELYIVFFDSDPSGGSNIGATISTSLCQSPRIISVNPNEDMLPIECDY